MSARLVLVAAILAGTPLLMSAGTQPYDVVLTGGRVLDPETSFDAVRDVGIRDGVIAAISAAPLDGRVRLDVRGRVVAPGFIDLHSHAVDEAGQRRQLADGVTTALELEEGVFPVSDWYAEREGRALIHYGASAGHIPARIAAFEGVATRADALRVRRAATLRPAWSHAPADAAMQARIEAVLERGLQEGALGVGLAIAESPGASREEVLAVFRAAAAAGVPVYGHPRGFGPDDVGGAMDGFQELLADATATGAGLHVVHLGSSGLAQAPLIADMIAGARARGLDVTAEVYPYTAGLTFIQSGMFDDGWTRRLGIGYGDLEWPPTGERLTEQTFARRRAEGGFVILHMIPEAALDALVKREDVIFASDAVPLVNGRGHPRGAGTFARVLGRYVRERALVSLMEAVRRMTLLPARRVAGAAAQMARKGRLQEGADADLVVFDPATVLDRATFAEPARPSHGIEHVLVAGTLVVRSGRVIEGVRPGRPVRASARASS